MRAVIYTRVSQDRNDRASVQQQEDEARAVVATEGWTLATVFCDNDRSASQYAKKDRPEFRALLDFLASGRAGVLVLWESSRGSRDNEDWNALLKLCERHGVLVHVVDHRRTYDVAIPRDWRTLAEDGVDNTYESKKTRGRVLRSMRAAAVKGTPHGKLAYGYAREYDTATKKLVRQYVREDQAVVIREMADRVVAGESLYAITKDLNARGIKAPRAALWSTTTALDILRSPRYVAQRVHQGKVVGAATWPAILDEATYLSVRRVLEDPRRKVTKDWSLKHLLSGILRCGVCQGEMRVQQNRGYLTYVCRHRYCTAVRSTKVEAFVEEVVLERLSRPDFLEAVAARSGRKAVGVAETTDALQERLDGFYEAAAAGALTPRALAQIEARLLPEIETARQRALEALVAPVLSQVAGEDIRERWGSLSLGTRRRVIDALMTITVNPGQRGKLFTPERLAIEWKTL